MSPETYDAILAAIADISAVNPDHVSKCFTCGFTWDDTMITSLTPTPAGRCPNEHNHEEREV